MNCSIPGCEMRAKARGWCGMHFMRWKRHGDPLKLTRAENGAAMEFFRNVVLPYREANCLIWPFWCNNYGYGCLRINGKDRLVSRILCEIVNGSPPSPKHDTAHSCGNGHKGCVTAQHIRWATRAENEADKVKHGTSNRGERQGSSRLTKEHVKEIRKLKDRFSHQQIADLFAVSQSHITRIINRQAWTWLE